VCKGDSADTCARRFLLVLMGGRTNGQACADGERGPPSARTEIYVDRLDDRFISEVSIKLNSTFLQDFIILNTWIGQDWGQP
jgi:hypothetical protein